jgi:hypothetical protein
MRRAASIFAAIAVIGFAGCHTEPNVASRSRPAGPAGVSVAPVPPSVVASGCSTWETRPGSVTALVHVRTTLYVSHMRVPQAGAPGLVTVDSIDVVFMSGGAQVGWATQAPPQGNAGLVIGNGEAELTVTAYSIYLFGRWAPHCRVVRVYWLPGNHR